MNNNTKELQLTTHPNETEQTLVNQVQPDEPVLSRGEIIEKRFREARYGNSIPLGSWISPAAKDDLKVPEKK